MVVTLFNTIFSVYKKIVYSVSHDNLSPVCRYTYMYVYLHIQMMMWLMQKVMGILKLFLHSTPKSDDLLACFGYLCMCFVIYTLFSSCKADFMGIQT